MTNVGLKLERPLAFRDEDIQSTFSVHHPFFFPFHFTGTDVRETHRAVLVNAGGGADAYFFFEKHGLRLCAGNDKRHFARMRWDILDMRHLDDLNRVTGRYFHKTVLLGQTPAFEDATVMTGLPRDLKRCFMEAAYREPEPTGLQLWGLTL